MGNNHLPLRFTIFISNDNYLNTDGKYQCGPGSILAQCCMWVEHFGSHFLLCSKGFSPGLPPSTKTDISKSQFEQDRGPS